MRTVAVGFDGSPDALAALRWGADLAVAVGADLVVVHAVGMLEHAGLSAPPAAPSELEATARRVTAGAGLDPGRCRWRQEDGDPPSVLLRAAKGPEGADLVVVGTRGAAGHPGVLLGSTSLELARHAAVPLVIVPSDGPARTG